MISHRYKCIFIHIPKTAGTSIEKKLGHFEELRPGVQDHRTIRQLEPQPDPQGPLRRLREEIAGFNKPPRQPGTVTPRQYRSYFKFTFVRNPWARAFSWYRNVMDDERHQSKIGVPSGCSFKEFLENHGDQFALRPQTHWILDRSGNNPLDFTGRFERLRDGFTHVSEKLGLSDAVLPTLMVRPGEQPSYVPYYDGELIDLIALRYREEIEMFDYRFGD